MAQYYAQRAGAGLIIAEGASPSPNGVGYCNMPALYTHEQVKEWRKITDAVHEKGGKIFLQVMHTGRIGHINNLPKRASLLAPSPIAQSGEITTDDFGKQNYSVSSEVSIDEINNTIQEYIDNAKLSFDGVEIHCAHGYL